MAQPETCCWILGDFNKSYANNKIPFESNTVSSKPLSEEERDFLSRDLPDTGVWKIALPLVLHPELGMHPMAAWTKLAPYLGFDDKIIEIIDQYYLSEEQFNDHSPWYLRSSWKALALEHKIQHILPYQVKTSEYEGIKKIKDQGGQFSFVTALLEHNQADFIAHLNNTRHHDIPLQKGEPATWQVIQDLDIPLWMRKGHRIYPHLINPYKTLVYKTMLEYIKGVNQKSSQPGLAKCFRVIGWDDDVNFALSAVALFHKSYNLRMHMPQSFAVAMLQQPDLAIYAEWIGRKVEEIFFMDDPLIVCQSGPAQISQLKA